jgi:hypothetical protein
VEPQTPKADLIKKISARIAHDEKWAKTDFLCAQIFVWLTILASFFTAILAATEKVSPLLVAFLAAIPGTVIVVEKSFSFGKRARWHWEMVATLEGLLNSLLYEEASIDEVSRQLSEHRKVMEKSFPILYSDGQATAQTAQTHH